MANYTKTVDFAAKDALASGTAAKRILGTEINTELANIQTAIATKLDSSSFSASSLTTGVLATANGGTGSTSSQYCSLTTNVSGTLPPANGGTGLTSFSNANALLVSSSSTALSVLLPTTTSVLTTDNSGVVGYTQGAVANKVLRTNGLTVSFGAVVLTSDVSGILPIANGGTGGSTASDARAALDVPDRAGTFATGTWNIDISGNATTATTATNYAGTINVSTQATGTLPIVHGGTGQTSAGTAATALGVPGAGQTWASFLGSRAINTDYQNTTGRPIVVSVAITTVSGGNNQPTFWVSTTAPATGGAAVAYFTNGTTNTINATVGPVIVPDQAYYRVQANNSPSISMWAELR